MKRLVLLRHGKSDWDAGAATDHERPLAKRGVRAAKTMGQLLAAAGVAPDLVVTSSALRARTTAELAMEAGGWHSVARVEASLYGASPGEVIRVIQSTDDHVESLLLVGHEPTWSSLASVLTGGSRVRVATATAVGMDLDVIRWSHVEPSCGELAWLLPPRLFEFMPQTAPRDER